MISAHVVFEIVIASAGVIALKDDLVTVIASECLMMLVAFADFVMAIAPECLMMLIVFVDFVMLIVYGVLAMLIVFVESVMAIEVAFVVVPFASEIQKLYHVINLLVYLQCFGHEYIQLIYFRI